jgi:hypothetical protein
VLDAVVAHRRVGHRPDRAGPGRRRARDQRAPAGRPTVPDVTGPVGGTSAPISEPVDRPDPARSAGQPRCPCVDGGDRTHHPGRPARRRRRMSQQVVATAERSPRRYGHFRLMTAGGGHVEGGPGDSCRPVVSIGPSGLGLTGLPSAGRRASGPGRRRRSGGPPHAGPAGSAAYCRRTRAKPPPGLSERRWRWRCIRSSVRGGTPAAALLDPATAPAASAMGAVTATERTRHLVVPEIVVSPG